jgi:hypothetical protein
VSQAFQKLHRDSTKLRVHPITGGTCRPDPQGGSDVRVHRYREAREGPPPVAREGPPPVAREGRAHQAEGRPAEGREAEGRADDAAEGAALRRRHLGRREVRAHRTPRTQAGVPDRAEPKR